jgi:hypothetical protein
MRAHRVVVFGVAVGLTQLAPAQAAVVHIPTPTLLWFIAGIAIGIIFHEAGHALCAMIARIPIRRVLIGIGPLLLRTRVGDVQLELRLLLLGGAVYYKPPFPPHRLATIFVVLGQFRPCRNHRWAGSLRDDAQRSAGTPGDNGSCPVFLDCGVPASPPDEDGRQAFAK